MELRDGKVGGCTLPFLAAEPTTPFSMDTGGDRVSAFVAAVLSGQLASPPPLAKLDGTDFQREVWRAIANIPFGKTKTYSELAAAIGRPKAVRAVGSACGKNPVPLFIPCHRVVGAQGGLGGFSCGLLWKKLLLPERR